MREVTDAVRAARTHLLAAIQRVQTYTWLQTYTKKRLYALIEQNEDAYFIYDALKPLEKRRGGWWYSTKADLLIKEVGTRNGVYPRFIVKSPRATEGEELVIWCD